jgi:hypothetical protein
MRRPKPAVERFDPERIAMTTTLRNAIKYLRDHPEAEAAEVNEHLRERLGRLHRELDDDQVRELRASLVRVGQRLAAEKRARKVAEN